MKKARILAIDDNLEFLELLESFLTDESCDILVTSKEEECLEYLKSKTFDILLIDLNMPGVSTVHIIKQARKLQKGINVVIASGSFYMDPEQQISSLADHFLDKAFGPDQLIAVIRRYCP